MAEDDGSLVKILNPVDIDKAYELGFECIGYPDEVVKYLTDEEFKQLAE
jgi:hypothetical protein